MFMKHMAVSELQLGLSARIPHIAVGSIMQVHNSTVILGDVHLSSMICFLKKEEENTAM